MLSLSSGTRLGPYEIIALLGAGGMGEVYRARDTRLGRDVALKILPESFARESDRLHRFEQEAQAPYSVLLSGRAIATCGLGCGSDLRGLPRGGGTDSGHGHFRLRSSTCYDPCRRPDSLRHG